MPPGFRARCASRHAGMACCGSSATATASWRPTHWRADAVGMTTTHDLPTVAGWWRARHRPPPLGLGRRETQRAGRSARLWQAFTDAGVDGDLPPADRAGSGRRCGGGLCRPAPGPLVMVRSRTSWALPSSRTCRAPPTSIPTGAAASRRRRELLDTPALKRLGRCSGRRLAMTPRATSACSSTKASPSPTPRRWCPTSPRSASAISTPRRSPRRGRARRTATTSIDPTRVNPELGGEAGFAGAGRRAARGGLGLIVDIVPNHMAATRRTPGGSTCCGTAREPLRRYFDIDWESGARSCCRPRPPARRGPGRGDARARRRSTLFSNPAEARRLTTSTTGCLVAHRRRAHQLAALLRRQRARLPAHGGRRGVRGRACDVAAALRRGDGRRRAGRPVDGLADPAGYCRKLRPRLDDPGGPISWSRRSCCAGERLPADWGCDGTTGYDFMDEVSALQHDPPASARWPRPGRR